MEFLEQFVFEPDELGQLWYEFKYPAELCCYQMVIFNDKPQQWPYVRENEDKLTCLEKKAQIPGHYNTQVTLSTPYKYNCVDKTEDGKQMLVCSGTHHFMAKRERWLFINVANCNNMSLVEGIHMQYKLNMTNRIRPMDMHFSADQRYITQTRLSIAFAVLYFLMTLVAYYYRYELTRKRLLHSTYQLFFFSILLQLASLTFSVNALADFARYGTEMPELKTAGHVLSFVSDVVFILTLMLVVNGYTITRGRISTGGSVKLAIFNNVSALTLTFLYTFAMPNYEPLDVMFIYGFQTRWRIIVMRFIDIVWLYYCIVFTAKHFEKFKIYLLFMVFILISIAAEPVMMAVANNAFIPSYKRVNIVTGIYWAVSFMGQFSCLILNRPDRTNEYFPYHIKTNQPASMNGTNFAMFCVEKPKAHSNANVHDCCSTHSHY